MSELVLSIPAGVTVDVDLARSLWLEAKDELEADTASGEGEFAGETENALEYAWFRMMRTTHRVPRMDRAQSDANLRFILVLVAETTDEEWAAARAARKKRGRDEEDCP